MVLKTAIRSKLKIKVIFRLGLLHIVSILITHHLLYRPIPCHATLDVFIANDRSLIHSFSQSDSPFIAGHDLITLNRFLTHTKPPPIAIKKQPTGPHYLTDRISEQVRCTFLRPSCKWHYWHGSGTNYNILTIHFWHACPYSHLHNNSQNETVGHAYNTQSNKGTRSCFQESLAISLPTWDSWTQAPSLFDF